MVRARVVERVKEEAAAILGAAGLTVCDAFSMMLMRAAADRALPFDPLVPNQETIEAMKEARAGNLPRVDTVEWTSRFKKDYKREKKGQRRASLD